MQQTRSGQGVTDRVSNKEYIALGCRCAWASMEATPCRRRARHRGGEQNAIFIGDEGKGAGETRSMDHSVPSIQARMGEPSLHHHHHHKKRESQSTDTETNTMSSPNPYALPGDVAASYAHRHCLVTNGGQLESRLVQRSAGHFKRCQCILNGEEALVVVDVARFDRSRRWCHIRGRTC